MIKSALLSRRAYDAARLILAGVFITAGAVKMTDAESFELLIGAYGLAPQSWIKPASYALPLLEVIAGAGLALNARGSLPVMACMLVFFMGVLSYGIHMGLAVDCGCFGPEDREGKAFSGLWPALYRDMAMMAGVIYLASCRRILGIRLLGAREIFNRFAADITFKGKKYEL